MLKAVPRSQLAHPTVVAFQRMRAAMGQAKLHLLRGTAVERIAELTPAAEAGDEAALVELCALEAAQNCRCPAPGALSARPMPQDVAFARVERLIQKAGLARVGGCAPCAFALL